MKIEFKGFSKYYYEDGNVFNKQTGRKITVDKNGCVSLLGDNGHRALYGLKKLLKGKQDYKQIEQEQNVKYKPVFGAAGYMFC